MQDKFGKQLGKLEKFLRKDFKEIKESFWKNSVEISCNFQENLKKLEEYWENML